MEPMEYQERTGVVDKIRTKLDYFVLNTAAFPFFVWVAIFAHMLEGITGYTVSMKLTKYLSQRLLMSDIEASNVYSFRIVVVFALALMGGWVIDKIGIRFSIVFGFLIGGLVRLALAVANSRLLILSLIVLGMPISGGLLVTPIHMAVDALAYSTPAEMALKNFAFNILYASNNFGDELIGLVDPYITGTGGAHQYDLMFFVTGVVSILSAIVIFATFFPPKLQTVDVVHFDIDYSAQFKKCLAFAAVMCPVRTLFQYLDILMSKYTERLHNAQWLYLYQYQIDATAIISINPMTVLILTPIMGILLRNQRTIVVLIIGTFFSALSPLFMLLWRDTSSALPEQLFMLSFSIAESIYSSRSVQMLMNLTPPGKKGLYSTIAILPALIASGLAGEQAGYLLYYFCPTTVNLSYDPWQRQSCSNLWFPIVAQALLTPLLLFALRNYFESPMAMHKKPAPPIEFKEIKLEDSIYSVQSQRSFFKKQTLHNFSFNSTEPLSSDSSSDEKSTGSGTSDFCFLLLCSSVGLSGVKSTIGARLGTFGLRFCFSFCFPSNAYNSDSREARIFFAALTKIVTPGTLVFDFEETIASIILSSGRLFRRIFSNFVINITTAS